MFAHHVRLQWVIVVQPALTCLRGRAAMRYTPTSISLSGTAVVQRWLDRMGHGQIYYTLHKMKQQIFMPDAQD